MLTCPSFFAYFPDVASLPVEDDAYPDELDAREEDRAALAPATRWSFARAVASPRSLPFFWRDPSFSLTRQVPAEFSPFFSSPEWHALAYPRFPTHSPTWWKWVLDPATSYSPFPPDRHDVEIEEEELRIFRFKLPILERNYFDRGKRLGSKARATALTALSSDDIAKWGLQFPDDPAERKPPVLWSPLVTPPPDDAYRHTFRLRLILMDAWFVLPPLHLDYMAAVIRCGVSLAFEGDRSPRSHRNHPSLLVSLPAVHEVLLEEVAGGRRPPFLACCPFDNAIVVPIGNVPKSKLVCLADGTFAEESSVRVIHDWSQGYLCRRVAGKADDSLNSGIVKMRIAFLKFDDILRCFLDAGRGAWVIVLDFAHAHQSVMVRRCDWPLGVIQVPGLGWSWSPCCQYGSSRSAGIWEVFGEFFVVSLLARFGIANVLRWVDDCFAFLRCSYLGARMIQGTINYLSRRYGMYLQPLKVTGPASSGKCLGLLWHPRDGKISFPPAKLERYRLFFQVLLTETLWTLKEVQQAVGRLQYISYVIWQLRFVLPSWWAFVKRFTGSPDWTTLKPPSTLVWHVRAFLAMLEVYPGSSAAYLHSAVAPPSWSIYTDASSEHGFGAYCEVSGRWLSALFSEEEKLSHIVHLKPSSPLFETKGVIYSLCSFGYRDANVVIFNDNKCFTDKWNGDRFGSNHSMNMVIINLLQTEVFFNLSLSVRHVPGVLNIYADPLSRGAQGRQLFLDLIRIARPSAVAKEVAPRSPLSLVFNPPQTHFWSPH